MPAGMDASTLAVMTPAEREARWTLWMLFAIEAASEADARAIADGVLAQLGLPLAGQPSSGPLGLRDAVWVVTADIDLTGLAAVDPDSAETRGRYVSGHFGEGVRWTVRATQSQAKWEWPPDIWSRRPGMDDVLIHPAILAVIIWALAK